MKSIMTTILFLVITQGLWAQNYIDALIVKSDDSVMECLVKTPFNAYKEEIGYKKSDSGKVTKIESTKIKYLILLPETDSETILAFTKFNQYNAKGTSTKIVKNPVWLRMISGCEEIELFEFVSSIKSSRSQLLMVYAQQGFTNYYIRRVDEKLPSMVSMNLDALRPHTTGMAGGKKYNQRILSAYFNDQPKLKDKINSEKVSLNTVFELVNSQCN